MGPIGSINGLAGIPHIPATTSKSGPAGFSDVLREAIQTVDTLQTSSKQSIERFLSGEGEELHQTVLSVQKAEMAFELTQQVRNKVVSAYQEIMRMQV
jgi:flagellar hook-basal body complex protein FliE